MTLARQSDEHMEHLVQHTVSMLRNGHRDPTTVYENDTLWRATLTPLGAGTICITHVTSSTPCVRHFGPGGEWLAERALDLLGHSDQPPIISAQHNSVARAQRRFGQLRLPRSHSAYHELLPAVLGQRVTSIEAFGQWRQLCMRFGARAPGPRDDLFTPPDPQALSRQPYFVLHRFGIEKRRANALVQVARNAPHLITDIDFTRIEASTLTQQLTRLRGIGVWTAATAGGLAYGDPDALLVGDFHVKNNVSYALTGRPRGTDEDMVAHLQAYSGQRARVVKWLELDGWIAPKFGPRQRISSIVNR